MKNSRLKRWFGKKKPEEAPEPEDREIEEPEEEPGVSEGIEVTEEEPDPLEVVPEDEEKPSSRGLFGFIGRKRSPKPEETESEEPSFEELSEPEFEEEIDSFMESDEETEAEGTDEEAWEEPDHKEKSSRFLGFFGRNKATESETDTETPGEEPTDSDTDEVESAEVDDAPKSKMGFLSRLKSRLSKTRSSFKSGMDRLLHGKKEIDDELLEELEELLITSDLGVKTTMELIQSIEKKVGRKELVDPSALRSFMQEEIGGLVDIESPPMNLSHKPSVIMVVGVNGTGKTTTIGKLAHKFRSQGKSVILAAGDTFRAAAIEQLEVWAQRGNCTLIKHQSGSDPSAVAYDAVEAATARQSDIVIVDTAGRLHTQKNLMEQLKKMKRVIENRLEGAPHEVWLVLDATTGQNALVQARLFHEALGITGFILTKLDGTAKGGIAVAILREMQIPIRYIGIGEAIEDLRPFDSLQFVEAIFKD